MALFYFPFLPDANNINPDQTLVSMGSDVHRNLIKVKVLLGINWCASVVCSKRKITTDYTVISETAEAILKLKRQWH